jgi:hypothetical protein
MLCRYIHHSFNFIQVAGAEHSFFLARRRRRKKKIDAAADFALFLVFFARAVTVSPRSAASLIYFRSALRASFLGSRSASVDMFDRYTIEPLHLARMVTYLPIRAAKKTLKSAPTYLSPAPNGRVRRAACTMCNALR